MGLELNGSFSNQALRLVKSMKIRLGLRVLWMRLSVCACVDVFACFFSFRCSGPVLVGFDPDWSVILSHHSHNLYVLKVFEGCWLLENFYTSALYCCKVQSH